MALYTTIWLLPLMLSLVWFGNIHVCNVIEGEEADSDVTSSDESDWSSEEDEDDSVEGGFDDSMCPPGCDQVLRIRSVDNLFVFKFGVFRNPTDSY